MPFIGIHVDEETYLKLKVISSLDGRSVAQLAEDAVADEAVQAVPMCRGKPLYQNHKDIWDALKDGLIE